MSNRIVRFLPLFLCLVVVSTAYAFNAPFFSDPGALGLAMAGMAAVDGAVATEGPWRRIRRDLPSFDNVPTTGVTSCVIPRNAATLLGITLRMGGTTFNESHVTEGRLKLGSKILTKFTGAHLRKMNAWRNYYDGNRQFLPLSFTPPESKEQGGEFVGGFDMTRLPPGRLVLELTITGATAPTLTAKGHWGPPQDNDVLSRLLQFTWSTSAAGRRVIPLDFNGARIRNLFFLYGGTDFVTTATSTAWTANTGTGAMGAITVAAAAQVGTHKLICIEPAANAGVFLHETPDGKINSLRLTVAAAYSSGGLAMTLADATDFISGDGFDIVVSENTDGNISRIEVIKNGEAVYDHTETEARYFQKWYGFLPQTKMFVVPFELDHWLDGSLRTDDARTLEIAATLTASDDLTIYADVLDTAQNN